MHVRFRRGNALPYHQDFRAWQGIPWQPTFTVADGPRPDLLTLRARGYGVLDRTPSQYGNGALFITRDVIEDGACVVVEPRARRPRATAPMHAPAPADRRARTAW